jgi:hypothetical protein
MIKLECSNTLCQQCITDENKKLYCALGDLIYLHVLKIKGPIITNPPMTPEIVDGIIKRSRPYLTKWCGIEYPALQNAINFAKDLMKE